MKRHKISEVQRDPKIDPFGVQKIGVPTMGGIIIIVSILVPVLLLGRMRNIYLLLMIVTTVWLGFLGFMDDYIKIFRKNKEGLKGIYKIVGQVSIGFIVGLTLWLSPDAVVRENINVRQNQEVVVKHKQLKNDVKPLHSPPLKEKPLPGPPLKEKPLPNPPLKEKPLPKPLLKKRESSPFMWELEGVWGRSLIINYEL